MNICRLVCNRSLSCLCMAAAGVLAHGTAVAQNVCLAESGITIVDPSRACAGEITAQGDHVAGGQGNGPGAERENYESQLMEERRLAERVEAESALASPDPRDRLTALERLVHFASSRPAPPEEIRLLVVSATADRDPHVAGLAERALFNLEERTRGQKEETPERELMERSRRSDLERARQVLSGDSADPADRTGAVTALVHLAAAAPQLAEEVTPVLEEVRAESDPDLARLAERALARLERRPVDPAFAPPTPPRSEPAAEPEHQEVDPFAALTAERPGARLAGLELILDAALSENRRDDPQVLDAFVKLLEDPDPRVAYRAGNALRALAGDQNALADVYVGGTGSGLRLGPE